MRPYKRDGAEFAQAAFRWVLSNAKRALVVNMVSKVVPHDELMAAAEDMVARILRNDRFGSETNVTSHRQFEATPQAPNRCSRR